MGLWVPPAVEKRQREEANAYTASVESMIDRFRGVLGEYTRLLKEIDPYLELIFAPPNADLPGLVPGRYHVMRVEPGRPPSFFVVEGDDGEFVEPNSRLLDVMRANDTWSAQAVQARREAKARREREKQAERERERAQIREELVERWQAATRAFVSMDRSQPWTQSMHGRRGRRTG